MEKDKTVMVIPKYTLLRSKTNSELQHAIYNPCVAKFNMENLEKWKKRLNTNIRNRVQSTLSFNSLRLNELGELLSLIVERAQLEGHTLDDIIHAMEDQYRENGDYSKGWCTTENIITTEEDITSFISIIHGRNITKKVREKYPFQSDK